MWVMTSVETLGYYHMSLRDNDLARFFGSSLVANPSGIGQECPRSIRRGCFRSKKRRCARSSVVALNLLE